MKRRHRHEGPDSKVAGRTPARALSGQERPPVWAGVVLKATEVSTSRLGQEAELECGDAGAVDDWGVPTMAGADRGQSH